MITVEICTPSLASAEAAQKGGAQRIELCRNLETGGLTPTADDIEYCIRNLELRTHVLVRPRAGDFCYNDAEIAEIERTVNQCRALGATAVVVGFLTSEGHIDVALTRRIVQLAAPMEVTFHRAFDEALQDPLEALQAVIDAGCHRLLTSGQAPTAPQGTPVIKRLVEYTSHLSPFTSHLKILAGSGITPANVRQLIATTGVTEVHGSCKTTLPDGTIQTNAAQVQQMIANIKDL